MWAVIDTNVVVSGLITSDPGAPTARILDGMLEGRFPFVLSEALLAEYREVLLRPAIRRLHGLEPEAVDEILTAIVIHGAMRSPGRSAARAPDPGDQHLWDLLAAEPDGELVTGDRLLREHRPVSIPVNSPGVFVALLHRDNR